jgi:peptidyl-tRNA hydrolase
MKISEIKHLKKGETYVFRVPPTWDLESAYNSIQQQIGTRDICIIVVYDDINVDLLREHLKDDTGNNGSMENI